MLWSGNKQGNLSSSSLFLHLEFNYWAKNNNTPTTTVFSYSIPTQCTVMICRVMNNTWNSAVESEDEHTEIHSLFPWVCFNLKFKINQNGNYFILFIYLLFNNIYIIKNNNNMYFSLPTNTIYLFKFYILYYFLIIFNWYIY